MQQPFDLSGKVALVTGAYRGLGFAIAQGLARAGAKVVLNGRRQDALDAAAQLLRDEQLEVSTCLFDVTDRDAIGAGVAAIESSIGAVDILFNNAGIQRRGTFADFPQEQWDEIIATNLTAPFAVSQAVLPQMIAKKRGKIVHIASLMSELARPSVVPYTEAKGGVQQLTRGMAVELAPHNVEFNAWVSKRTPAGRWGQPEELAGLAVFLASSASNYMAGQMLVMDGGMSVAL